MTSIFELIDAKVGIKKTTGRTTTITVYDCPLIDPALQKDLLPKLLSLCTLTEDQEFPARINVNTAPREVLLAIPDISETDVETIIGARPRLSSSDAASDAFMTSAWLATEAQLTSATLKKIEKYVTGRTQVYRVQSVGSFEGKGPTIRVEAVIDINGGRPRILAWRDLSELGKGLNEQAP
jgi:type II secretory pathway component PulK